MKRHTINLSDGTTYGVPSSYELKVLKSGDLVALDNAGNLMYAVGSGQWKSVVHYKADVSFKSLVNKSVVQNVSQSGGTVSGVNQVIRVG